ncbi:hypothetical protein HDU98_010992 [Podochytrium sp. JEL0797]|nr:hypothetical protein HDU98_010992 [Podochytrium sp. JEL0797]
MISTSLIIAGLAMAQTPNLILDNDFAGACNSVGSWCITKDASVIAPWIVAPCTSVSASGCVDGEFEEDNSIFPDPLATTNVDLNPNGPSSLYQDVFVMGGFSGMNLTFGIGFNTFCGDTTGSLNVTLSNLANNAVLHSTVISASMPFKIQTILIPSSSCGKTRVQFTSLVGGSSSCGIAKTPPSNHTSLLPIKNSEVLAYSGPAASSNFTFTNFGQIVNFNATGVCLPTGTNVITSSMFINATLGQISTSQTFPLIFITNATQTTATFALSSEVYDSVAGSFVFVISPSPPANMNVLSLSTLSPSGTTTNGPVISGPVDPATNLTYTTNIKCNGSTQHFNYIGRATLCAISGSSCIQELAPQNFQISFTVSGECLFTYQIINNLVTASLTENGSTNLDAKQPWDLTLSSSILKSSNMGLTVTSLTIGDGSGANIPVDPTCWSSLLTLHSAGFDSFRFQPIALSSSIANFKGLSANYEFACVGGASLQFLLAGQAVLYTFNFGLQFNPLTSSKRDGNTTTEGSLVHHAAVDLTSSLQSVDDVAF